jgi:hypothetical protein
MQSSQLKRRELIALLGSAAAASPRILRARDGRRPSRQEQWTADFNAGNPNICGLFALELRYDIAGIPSAILKISAGFCVIRSKIRRRNSPMHSTSRRSSFPTNSLSYA